MNKDRGNTTAAYVATPNRYRTKWTASGEVEHAWIGNRESTEDEARQGFEEKGNGWHKRPSIHMPRWASRITLEITEVRVGRLQEIAEKDLEIEAEGVDMWHGMYRCGPDSEPCWTRDATEGFKYLWDSINADRGYPWEGNPWVWVVSFRAV